MKVLKYLTLALAVGLVFWGADAAAADGNIFTRAIAVVGSVFRNVRAIVYILGAFGLIAIAIMGIMGKLQLKWLAYLATGLAIVAAADAVVTYAINSGSSGAQDDASSNWSQQLNGSGK